MSENEIIRLSTFFGVLLFMALAEIVFPRKKHVFNKTARWRSNLSLALINVVILRIGSALSAISIATYGMYEGWGMLAKLPLPLYVDIVLGVIFLDLAIYAQHILSHKVPILWRIHKVHHSDRDMDVTTAVRFHPVEIVLSLVYKCLVIVVIGPLVASVVVFEILLNASAMFNHANVKLPKAWDSLIRVLIVTPDMHRVHHSIYPKETDSNYGFCLSVWDRTFGTYTKQPKDGHTDMHIGLSEYQTPQAAMLTWMLLLPFVSRKNKPEEQ